MAVKSATQGFIGNVQILKGMLNLRNIQNNITLLKLSNRSLTENMNNYGNLQ